MCRGEKNVELIIQRWMIGQEPTLNLTTITINSGGMGTYSLQEGEYYM